MKFLFWTSIIVIVYCYFGYPLLLTIWAKVFEQKVKKGSVLPSVSIVLSVWNEEDVIEKKVTNLLSLDYPNEKLEILIGSDGSKDQTDAIIKNVNDKRIRLFGHNSRRGKMATINELVHESRNDIIIFTDARQMFAKDAIKELVANFNDENVGCVSGELIFSTKDGGTARGINLYWNYEKFMRNEESKLHSMLGATGAIYAIRKELYSDVPTEVILDDMFIPFQIIKKGYRSVFDGAARAYDEVADSPREEHRRKARTLFGNYQMFRLMPEMFNVLKSPIAVQHFSHKFLRVVVPFLMLLTFVVNILLITDPFYKILFYLQCGFYVMAIFGALARHSKYGILKILLKVCYVPYVFCLLNFSAFVGFLRFIGSKQEVVWEKARA